MRPLCGLLLLVFAAALLMATSANAVRVDEPEDLLRQLKVLDDKLAEAADRQQGPFIESPPTIILPPAPLKEEKQKQEEELPRFAEVGKVETKSETKVVEKLQGEENKAEEKKKEDAEHEELVRKSLNSLDLTSRFVEEDITNKTVQTKENLVAYAAIAYETVARAVTAEAYLKNQAVLLDDHLKTESYNLKTWIKNQYDAAKDRIKAEGRRIALLTDEVAELQHVYQDALAKEKSYQTQINQLSSERQLQRTPPLIPAVASAAMTDEQFTEAMQRLLSFDRAAVDVIRETSRAIAEKQRLISQGSAWIKNAEIVLQRWLATQNEIARKREQDGKKLVDTTKRRLRTVHNILEDATKFHAEYVHAIARMDLVAQIEALKQTIELTRKIKTNNVFQQSRNDAYIRALELEISAFEKKLASIPGDGSVVPPPSIWGVLSGFSNSAFPGGAPTANNANGPTPSNNLGQLGPFPGRLPQLTDYMSMSQPSPAAATAAGMPVRFSESLPSNMPQQQQQQQQQQGPMMEFTPPAAAPQPPQMPNLPPPPDFASVAVEA